MNYQEFLLEFIAWRLAAGNKEFGEFQTYMRETFEKSEGEKDAGEIDRSAEILRDVRTQPAAHAGEVPGHDAKSDVGVRINLGDKLAEAKERGRGWLSKK